MQGFCQTASFSVPATSNDESVSTSEDIRIPVHYTVISRRSKNRAGLRYQRRGIDDDAHVANHVETETIMQVMVRPSAAIKSWNELTADSIAGET